MSIEIRLNNDINRQIETIAHKAVRYAAEHILTESIRTTPKDTGLLQQSGRVTTDPNTLEAVVSFDTPYAVRLHEHPEYNFKNGRRGKWLELTVLEQSNNVANIMADVMRGDIGAS